jgi:hypothetical protein
VHEVFEINDSVVADSTYGKSIAKKVISCQALEYLPIQQNQSIHHAI